MSTLLPGLSARRLPTPALAVNVLEVDASSGAPVLFVSPPISRYLPYETPKLMIDVVRSSSADYLVRTGLC